jgi:hypothetical protein
MRACPYACSCAGGHERPLSAHYTHDAHCVLWGGGAQVLLYRSLEMTVLCMDDNTFVSCKELFIILRPATAVIVVFRPLWPL